MDDSVLDEIDNDTDAEKENKSTVTEITITNTNARSLCPKIDSMIDCFNEMKSLVGIITETWLADGESLQKDIADLSAGAGISLICRNRAVNSRGVAHGGVAISYKTNACNMKEVDLPNPDDFEVIVAAGSIPGYCRKLIVVACYLPPGYTVPRGNAALAYIEDVIIEIKRRYRDPFIVIGGDFNQWRVESALVEYPDIREADVGPTRKDKCLDRLFTNFGRSIEASGTVPPLRPYEGEGAPSDHRVAYVRATLPRIRSFEWTTYQYRYFNEDSVKKFGQWLAGFDWYRITELEGSNKKADYYQATVTEALEKYFPLIKVRRKTTDCPWINNRIRKLIKNRNEIYLREGWSAKWRRMKKWIDGLVKRRQASYLQSQRNALLVDDARRNFFRHVKAYQSVERPKKFDPRSLFPGQSDAQVAEGLADYFNRISQEFEPLEPRDIPRTYDRPLPRLVPFQVAGRIRAFKKPKSMVSGDIFPALVHRYSDLLAVPLTEIYNEISSSSVWPLQWKREFVTVIPKCRTPTELGDLRNISCTMLASKIYESFVLNWLSSEVSCKDNQYGGVKGCSVGHLLVDLWDEALGSMEDDRAGAMITGIDYAKAFNRLSFQHCLKAFAKKGASSQTLALLATFLSNRTMSVRVDDTWSKPRPVHGGVPQGSILGILLFNVSTDDLEDEEGAELTFVDTDESSSSRDVNSIDTDEEAASLSDGRFEEGSSSSGLDDPTGDWAAPDGGWTSTPTTRRGRPTFRESPLRPRGPRMTARDWSFMPGRRNRRRRRNLQRRISYSDEGEVSVAPEVNLRATGLRWKARKARKLKFVDDGLIVTKINMRSGTERREGGNRLLVKHDLLTQNMFRRVVGRASQRGMVVNSKKTKVLCMSDAMSYVARSFFLDADGERIESGNSMKILGFHFDTRPSCHAHINALRRRMRETTWVLRHLKNSGFKEQELVRVYKTVIRPILDYCCMIYHPMMNDEQDQVIERLQAQALKNIFGYKMKYSDMRKRADLTTHRQRRIELCDKFAEKAAASRRFGPRWFPERTGRQGGRRGGEFYMERTARTDRLNNSPLFYFRRRLNGKAGKTYGERNRKYRED